MTHAAARPPSPGPLAERFWSIARGMDGDPAADDPVGVVRHVLAILDKLHRGEQGAPVSVATLSFLKMLRESEQNGDLSYAAPEQICGEVLDERALVFSVGVLLFERLTGRHPFGADKQRRVARIRRGEFGSGVNYFPTVPTGLRTILMKAMGPFAEERWSTLAELRSHLEQFIAHEERPYLPGTSSPRPPAPTRKRTVPVSDQQATKVVDMTDQVRQELARAADLKARDHRVAAGTIERPAVAVAPPTTTTTTASTAPAAPLYTLPETNLDLRPSRDRLRPFLWAAGGAAIASVVLFLTRGGGESEKPQPAPAPAVATAEPLPAAAPAPAPAPTVAAPAVARAVVPAAATPAPAVAPAFDAIVTGERAAGIARGCFSPAALSAGASFGLSVLFDEHSGRVKEIYFASGSGIPSVVRRCMAERLVTRAIAETPAPRAIVSYFVRLHGDTVHVGRTGKY